MYIKSTSGTEVFKNEYQIHDSINGIPTIEMDYTRLELNHAEPIYFLSKNWNDRFAMILKEEESIGDSSRVKFTGVHSFVYDFKASRIYDTYTQYFNLQNILNVVFEDTGYSFEISGDDSYYSEHFQNFGNKDKMSLFNQILDRWGLEYRVSGTTVYISNARGEDTSRQFRYKMNIENSKVNLDVSTGATYIRGFFGRKPEEHDEDKTDTSFEREMTHDLADVYGIRHAEPYSNQNITTVETADAYLKQRLEDTWKLSIEIDVIDLGADETVSVGDVVWAIDERLNLKFKTRIVELVSHYNADDEIYKQVAILGNQTMIQEMFANEVTAQDLVEEVEQSVNKQIEDSQAEFDNNFNQLRDEIAASGQSVLDEAIANIEAKDEAMREEFSVWSDDLEDLRSDYIASIQDMTGTIDGIGTNITNINDRVDNVFADVSGIQGFIGEQNENLNGLLYGVRSEFEDKISNINTWHYNLLRGSRFDENYWKPYPTGTSINTDEEINYYHFRPTDTNSNLPYVMTDEPYLFEAGVEYILSWDFQSFGVTVFDNIWLIASEDEERVNIAIHHSNNHIETNIDTVYLGVNYRRYWIKFSLSTDFEGHVRIGANLNNNPNGRSAFKIRLPYLTTSDRTQWMFHHMDNTQNLEEVTKRVTELEDGWETLITRTEYDFDTNEIRGTIRSIEDTVDGYSSTISNHENWITTNGSNVLQTVDEVSSKVWKSDIHNPNMIPFADFDDASNFDGWSTRLNKNKYKTSVSTGDMMSIIFSEELGYAESGEFKIVAGRPYTFTVEILFHDNYNAREEDAYLWLINPDGANQNLTIRANYSMEHIESPFSARLQRITTTVIPSTSSNNATIRVGLSTGDTNETRFYFRRPKLEVGEHYTPFHNSFSSFEQRADQINLTVYGTDGLESTVAQHVVSIGQIEGLVSDADGKASQALQTVDGFSNTVTSLSDSVNANVNLLPQIFSSWEIGSLDVSGNPLASTNRIRMKNHIPIDSTSNLYYSGTSTIYQISLRFYDANKNSNGGTSSWITRNSVISVPSGTRFIKVIFRRSNDATFTMGTWINNTKLEVGDKRTEAINAISQLEQRADSIAMTVQDVDLDGVIRQSDVSVEPTGVTIGSAYLGENQFASMFRVMPNAIEAISDNINFRGNLNVFGQISGISVDAVTSSFGSVYADFIEGLYTKTEYLEAFDAEVKRAFIKEAAIEELFAHDATIRKLEAIDLTANQIRIAFNDISPNVRINNQSMEFYDGANRVARMDRYGSRFYQEGVQVGRIGPTKIVGTNHFGLRFFLPEESEFMSWDVSSANAGVGTPKLIWSRGNEGYGWKAGFTFTDPVRVPGIIPVSATHDAERLYITSSSTVESGNGRATVLQLKNVDDASIPSGNIRGGSDIIFKPGTTHVRASAYGRVAYLAIASNSTRNVLTSNAPYEFTTTSASNYLTIDDQWQFRRLTSSKKYKYHNKFIDAVTASKLLEINPATWFDKTAVDDYTSELNDNYDGLDKDEIEQKKYVKEKIKPIPGLYAEDVKDAGLEDFVIYNEDGEVDGINQNLWVLLIPLVKELKSEIEELKEQLK